MPDIRSFFTPKGGAPAPKPAPKQVDDSAKTKRTSMPPYSSVDLNTGADSFAEGRKVVEDSDDDEPVEYVDRTLDAHPTSANPDVGRSRHQNLLPKRRPCMLELDSSYLVHG